MVAVSALQSDLDRSGRFWGPLATLAQLGAPGIRVHGAWASGQRFALTPSPRR